MFKNSFHIALLYLRITYRSRGVLIFQVVMPIIFTALIGLGTGNFNNSSDDTIRWPFYLVNNDSGDLGAALQAQLTADPRLDVMAADRAAAVAAVRDGNAIAALTLPPEFSQQMIGRQSLNLDFYVNPDSALQAQPVEQAILAGLSQLEGSITAAAIAGNTARALEAISAAEQADYFTTALEQAQTAWQAPPVQVAATAETINPSQNALIPDGFEQSSPGMMSMYAMFSMLGGATALIEERKKGTLRRLLVMPIHKGAILGGYLLGILFTGIIQILILILFGQFVLDVPWGNSPLALGVMVLSFAFAITSLGIMMAALARTLAQANSLSTIVVLSISALGGAWWPLDVVPGWLQTVGRFTPTAWAMQGFQDIITRGLGATAVGLEAAVLVGFGLLFLAVGIGRFRYE